MSSAARMSGGITSIAFCSSTDVGAKAVAPGISMILAIVLVRLDVVTTPGSASAVIVKSWIRSMTAWSVTLLASTSTPSVEENPVSSSSRSTSWTTCESWSIQRIGSDSMRDPTLGGNAGDEQAADNTASGGANHVGSEPSQTAARSISGRPDASLFVGRCFAFARPSNVTTMPVMPSITTPTASSTPKSRIIGTFEMRRAANASTPVNTATNTGGPMFARVSASGSST